MMLNKPSLIHLCIHQRLMNSIINNDDTIEWEKIMIMLGRLYHIPKDKRIQVVNELEEFGLIKRLDKFKVKVIRISVD